jgi:hypothetical protein
MASNASTHDEVWPELPLAAWKDTYATLHLWTQIVGKIRLTQTPWLNHSWQVVLYVTPSGLTTSTIPYGNRAFQIDFDFINHVLRISTSDGTRKEVQLYPRAVADFYAEVLRSLSELGLGVNGGALRPEKRVTARSKLPQKKCTGLHLPMNPVRNLKSTRSAWRRMRQCRSA